MDLPDQIAGVVHDIKNRLQLLSPNLSFLCENDSMEVRSAGGKISATLDEINHQLVLLLGLYRLEEANLFAQEECYLSDMLESVVARLNGDECRIDCPEGLTAFCDMRMITAVLGDALHNAARHSQRQVHVSAKPEGKGVLIRIEDDGLGVSNTVVETTGLGLRLAAKVAAAHRNGEACGYATLTSSESLGGACFELYLP